MSPLSLLGNDIRKAVPQRLDGRTPMEMALHWVKAHRIPGSGIPVHHKDRAITQEVTGYFIPTLWNLGERELAMDLARWEASVQRADGAFTAVDGTPYTFDTAQVARGFIAVLEAMPGLEGNLRRACDFVESQIDSDGRVLSPSYDLWKVPGGGMLCEYGNLYVLPPLLEAGRILSEPRYVAAVQRSLHYFRGMPDLVEFKPSFATLTHYMGYLIEALVELGELDLARDALRGIAAVQRKDGAIPAYPGVDWICSTGMAQLAVAWYKLGDFDSGNKAVAYLERLQNPTGGFYGSYGKEANYFPREEISWAVKFFLDCCILRNRTPDQRATPAALPMKTAPARKQNLSPMEWSNLMLDGATPTAVASHLANGKFLPWTKTLLDLMADSEKVLDLGSGRGEHSALLARSGKQMTLIDWSRRNLDFSAQLFHQLGLSGEFLEGDVTDPLPFDAASFDTVFCCGVLEFLPDDAIRAVLREAMRVCRKRVIVMVPNASCLSYRIGKWYMERAGTWVWRGESPFYTLKPYFRSLGDVDVREFTVAAKHSLEFLRMPMGRRIGQGLARFLGLQDHGQRAGLRQGYLLVTVGEKTRDDKRRFP